MLTQPFVSEVVVSGGIVTDCIILKCVSNILSSSLLTSRVTNCASYSVCGTVGDSQQRSGAVMPYIIKYSLHKHAVKVTTATTFHQSLVSVASL